MMSSELLDNPSTSEPSNQSFACDHCGLPSPPKDASGLTFCCQGCKGAYYLIHEWGLEDYYALRDRLLVSPTESVESRRSGGRQQFDDLDDASLLGASSLQSVGDGLVCCRLAIAGIHCGACVWLIERMSPLVPGWQEARVGMHDHSIEVTFDPARTKLSSIAEKLAGIGYQVSPWVEGVDADCFRKENRSRLGQIAIAGFCAMNAMWIAVALYAGEYSGMAASQMMLMKFAGVMLAIVTTVGPGRAFFRGAWASIRTRTPHMDLPIALGIGVGTISGVVSLLVGHADVYFDSVVMLVFLLLVGRWIQFRQQHRASDMVSLLTRLTPSFAVRLDGDGTRTKVLSDSLLVGDRISVAAGESVPVDGRLILGNALIDRSLMTGESVPVCVDIGGGIEGGSLNLQSPIEMETVATRSESRITRLMQLVQQASLRRTPIVQLADKIAGRFVLILLCLAFLTMLVWWQIDPMRAMSNSVALLIVACPCALALATPLAIAVAMGRAARRKLLIRSGETFERLATPGLVWFDKTGTLTTGRPIAGVEGLDDESLMLCASLESQCRHPVANAIVEAANRRGLSSHAIKAASQVQQIRGGGARGIVDGHEIAIGNMAFVQLAVRDVCGEDFATVDRIAKQGLTPVVIAIDGCVKIVLSIGDELRASSFHTVTGLRDRGWTVGILSGDHPATVAAIARRLGIETDMAIGGLSPEDKLQRIEGSQKRNQVVVMVGDGVNDSAALAAADVGIAVQGGAEASLQAAPVFLSDGDLTKILQLMDASRSTVRLIRRNFRVSLCYNLLAMTMAMLGVINPLIAAILMPISSLTILSLTLAAKPFGDMVRDVEVPR
jgi:Cu2+-exporting ATPase